MNAVIVIVAATALAVPAAGMDMVRHLLTRLPDVNRTGQSAAADVDLWIAPDGTIEGCQTPRTIGDESLVQQICPALIGYRMAAPNAADGTHAYADVSFPITLFPDRQPSLRRNLDSQLSSLREHSADERYFKPGAIRWSKGWRLLIEVGEDGQIRNCSRANEEIREGAAEEACALIADTTYTQKRNKAGDSVTYVKAIEPSPVR